MRKILAVAAALFMVFHSPCAQADWQVGKIAAVKGTARITHSHKASLPLQKGDQVLEYDIIETAGASQVKISFEDGTEITLSENGRLVVDDYVYDPERSSKNRARFSIFKAAFSYVSGLIDKNKNPDVSIKTAYGTIGIRGTQLFSALKKDDCWIFLKTGRIDVSNSGGKVTLTSGEGTTIRNEKTAPALPHLWKAGEISWVRSKVNNHDLDW